LLITACSGQATNQAEPVEVSIQLSWIHEYSSSGFHAAEKNNHYAEQNLKVTLAEGGFNENGYIDPIKLVVDGEFDFGLANASQLILSRSQGQPVMAIAAVLQRSPMAIVSLADSGINRPQDLPGKTVSVTEGGAMQSYMAMLNSQDIDPESVTTVPRTSFGVDPLLNGEVDALTGWIINEGVQIEEAGSEPAFLLLSDYGVETYDIVIFTTEEKVKNEPELVERFLRATLAGIRDTITDPEQAIEFTLSYNPQLDRDQQLRRLRATIPLINIPGQNPGQMQAAVWESTRQVLLEQGGMPEAIDLNTVYTTAFLDKIYAD
jgi:NitT/TauT family transport system substrate-binding protein